MKRALTRVAASLLALFMLLGVFPSAPVAAQGDHSPVDVYVAGDESVDPTAYADLLRTKLQDLGMSSSDVRVTPYSGSVATSSFDGWWVYDNYYSPTYPADGTKPGDWSDQGGMQPYYYYKETMTGDTTFYTDITTAGAMNEVKLRDRHIYSDGTNITFLGYGAPAYKDFAIYPSTDTGTKSVDFTIDASAVQTHTLEGAGFLFNAGIAAGKLSGYLVFYDYLNSKVVLYQFKGIDATALHRTAGSSLRGLVNGTTVFLVAEKAFVNNNSLKDISIVTTPTTLTFKETSGTPEVTTTVFSNAPGGIDAGTLTLDDTGFNGFGPFASYVSHGCNMLSAFTFTGLEMKVTKSVFDCLRTATWRPDARRFLVNVDDDGMPSLADEVMAEAVYRMRRDDVQYIGYGNGSTVVDATTNSAQANKIIADNQGKGLFIDKDDAQYSTDSLSADAAAAYILAQAVEYPSNPPTAAFTVDLPVAVDSVTDKSTAGAGNSIAAYEWSIKKLSDATYTVTSEATPPDLSGLSADADYILVLRVQDNQDVWSRPFPYIIFSETALERVPIATVEVSALTSDVHNGEDSLTVQADAFSPAGYGVDTYSWVVRDKNGAQVAGGTAADNPHIFDLTSWATGDYTVELTVTDSDDRDSKIASQAIHIDNDLTGPVIEFTETTPQDSDVYAIHEFPFDLTDAESDVKDYRISVVAHDDPADWGDWTGGDSGTVTLGEGVFDIKVEARDQWDNLTSFEAVEVTALPAAAVTFSPSGRSKASPEAPSTTVTITHPTETITDVFYAWSTHSTEDASFDDLDDWTEIAVDPGGSYLISTDPAPANGNYYLHIVALCQAVSDALGGDISSTDDTPVVNSSLFKVGPEPTKPKPTIPVGVNDETVSVPGTVTTHRNGETTTTTIMADNTALQKLLNSDETTITLNDNTASDVVVGQLNGQTVKSMENKDVTLEVSTPGASYSLPASEIDIDSVSESLGIEVELSDIKVEVTISKPDASETKFVEDTANNNNVTIMVPPVSFEVTCTLGDQTVQVSQFTKYVERQILIPDGVDPAKVTTAVIMQPDGSLLQIPTMVITRDGHSYAVVNSLTNSVYTLIYNEKTFGDISGHWAQASIENMASRKVLNGATPDTFLPDADITRAEFAAIVTRALGISADTGTTAFSDVAADAWYAKEVAAAVRYGLIAGYEDGTFRPDAMITREEAMAILARAMAWAGYVTEVSTGDVSARLSLFTDGSEVSGWAQSFAAVCAKHGVFMGSNGNLNPAANITRAETAVTVERMLKNADLIQK